MSTFTSFLFARPSGLEGAGRILDFGNTLTEYNYSPNGEVADYLAVLCDWRAIGNDVEEGLRAYSRLVTKEEKPGVQKIEAK